MIITFPADNPHQSTVSFFLLSFCFVKKSLNKKIADLDTPDFPAYSQKPILLLLREAPRFEVPILFVDMNSWKR